MKNTQNNRHATNFSAKLFGVAIIAILMSQTIVSGQTIISGDLMSGAVLVTATPQRLFYARNYGGKCLDFGAPPQVTGGPVYLYGCNNTIAQQIRVVEINDRHDVRLYLGNKVLGVKQALVNSAGILAAATAAPINDLPLELQNEADLNTIFARTQIFSLDGDSIIWAANRDMVVKVQNARGTNRTPLVAGKRNLSDEEFWDFVATDGSAVRPTTGFVRVPQAGDTRLPADQFIAAVRSGKRGTVIEVGADFALTDLPSVLIPAGVTIRGNRRGTLLGPELLALNQAAQEEFSAGVPAGMLQIAGDEVRITGLRISGPNQDGNVEDHTMPRTGGIVAPDQYRSIIDHNDLSNWTVAAVNVVRDEAANQANTQNARTRPQNTRIIRNFIHDNQYLYENNGSGYGIAIGNGGYPFIEGNLFLRNIHSIAGDGSPRSGYRALSNLILADDPLRGTPGFRKHSQDFDMHGTGGSTGNHVGGQAGEYIEIAWNTFLATNRENFNLRGEPSDVAEFHHNVSLRQASAALVCSSCGDGLKAYDNQFGASNPTNRLGVGDFDGDGRDDLFLATGAGWYYAPAGNAEWRFINAQTDKIDNLMFGDFDGDGRTDVFTQHGYNWDVSWGGRSKWEKINASGNILGNAAIGDFNGDHRADVFYTDGQHWYVSYGGNTPFTLVNDSGFRVPNLRFGDFNGDGKTDVFGVGAKYWQVSYSATGGWAVLQPRLTDTATYLLVTDFNGDGRADVTTLSMVTMSKVSWKVSYSGMDGWKELRTLPLSVKVAAIGRFDGNRSTDLLLWHDNYLDISANGTGAAQRQSRQDMR